MALPHLPSTYTTRKNIYEAAIVRRRNHDNDFHELWSHNSKYFNQSDVNAVKQKHWTSNASYQNSMDAWKSAHEKETKLLNLKRRRLKLAEMLKKERDMLQAELKGMSRDNYSRLEDMKVHTDELKSAREEKRKHAAEEKLYEHFLQNNADVRSIESDLHREHVIQEWSGQVDYRRQKLQEELEAKEEYERQMEEDRLMALEIEQQKELERYDEEKRMKRVLKEQVMELRRREAEAAELKKQQEMLMREQWQLEQLEVERKALETQRKKTELGRVLLRQHNAALRRKSKQIQEELELDWKILEALTKQEAEDQQIQTARREKARADAAWMKQVIEDQLRLEKTREAELDQLYQDEAARVWQTREAEWARERQARARLMEEVLAGRQDQIQDKMEEVRRQQEESIERREELLQELEIVNQMTHREKEKEEEAKLLRKKELESQITSRQEKHMSERQKIDQELDEEARGEKEYEEMLQREAERLRLRGFEPKIHTKRSAWT